MCAHRHMHMHTHAQTPARMHTHAHTHRQHAVRHGLQLVFGGTHTASSLSLHGRGDEGQGMGRVSAPPGALCGAIREMWGWAPGQGKGGWSWPVSAHLMGRKPQGLATTPPASVGHVASCISREGGCTSSKACCSVSTVARRVEGMHMQAGAQVVGLV